MLKLYHYDRSTAAQRVRLGLEEKELEWESIIVDTAMGDANQRPDNFHEFNPKGLIPLLDHNGFILPESTLILEYLDDAFSEIDKNKREQLARYLSNYHQVFYTSTDKKDELLFSD